MNPKPIMRALQSCSDHRRFAILKLLEVNKEMTYTILLKMLGAESTSSQFAYHVRKLRTLGAIEIIPIKRMYQLTENGKQILRILTELAEKHITDSPETICVNGVDDSHEFITICKNCGLINQKVTNTIVVES